MVYHACLLCKTRNTTLTGWNFFTECWFVKLFHSSNNKHGRNSNYYAP